MAQRKETQTNTRVLTKSLGTASILSLAIAGANVANALETDLSVEYRATAFALQSDSYEGADRFDSDTDNGLGHLLRVKANIKHESGVALYTSVELAGDRWNGDQRGYTGTGSTGAFNQANKGDNVRLDLGYAQIPLNDSGAILRVGRQAANWNNCLLVCDDRRDRILSITPTAIGSVIALYDRRADSTRAENQDNGDMVSAGLVTKLGDFNAGFLWVHWLKNFEGSAATPPANGGAAPYSLQDVHIISPYVDGTVADGAIRLAAGFNYVGSGEVEAGVDDVVFTGDSWSQYLRAGTDAGPVALDLQYVGTQDGGLISSGFDTYSSAINNNPESTSSSTSIYTMGNGSGLVDDEERLIIARAAFDLSPQLKIHAAVGQLNVDNGSDDDSSMVYDLQAHYQLSEAVKTWATVGMITENDVGSLTANGLGGAAVDGGFDDVLATSLNMSVMF